MAAGREIYERVAREKRIPGGLPLIVLLTGFTDAGGAVSGAIDYLRSTLEPEPIAVFANDVLLDYRARRPIITFDRDHLTDYRPQRLELSLVRDALGQSFLLLAGYEPDFAWEEFVSTVLSLAEEIEASGVTWAHAIAMPVPHTRDLGTTISGNRRELIESQSVWQPRTQLPATAGHLLEYRASEAGLTVAGFTMLIPHYLADTEYPAATATLLDRVAGATGRVFDLDDLDRENREYLRRVDEQIAGNDELGRMLQALEERYDSYRANQMEGDGDGLIDEGNLPSADELAAELERFLATRPSAEGEARGDGDTPFGDGPIGGAPS